MQSSHFRQGTARSIRSTNGGGAGGDSRSGSERDRPAVGGTGSAAHPLVWKQWDGVPVAVI